MGCVYQAHDERLDRPVALKKLLPGGSRRRFLREARLTARLQHPSIVPIYDAGELGGDPFYAMKLVEGTTLAEHLDGKNTFVERVAYLPHLIAVAEAVAYAHSQGVLHRDLKPENIILGSHGETLVLDWGIAIVKSEEEVSATERHSANTVPEITCEGAIVGTPQYMAPERALGGGATERCDVYSLGVILALIVTGHRPYGESPGNEVLAKLRAGIRPVLCAGDAPPELLAIAAKAIAWNEADRYVSAEAFVADLKRFQDGRLVGAANYTLRQHLQRFIKRHKTSLAIAAAFLLVLSGVAITSFFRIREERNAAHAVGVALQQKNEDLLYSNALNNLPTDPTATLAWLKLAPPRQTVADLAAVAAGYPVATFIGRPYQNAIYDVFKPAQTDSILLAFPGKVSLVDLQARTSRTVSFANENPLFIVAEDASLALFPGSLGGITEVDLRNGALGRTYEPTTQVRRAAISPDARYVALTTATDALLLYERSTSKRVVLSPSLTADSLAVNASNNSTVAACTAAGKLLVYQDSRISFQQTCAPGIPVVMSRDGTLSWVARDQRVHVRGPNGLERIFTSSDPVRLALSLDGSVLVVTRQDGTVEGFSLSTQQLLGRHRQLAPGLGLAVAPDGSAFASSHGSKIFHTYTSSGITTEFAAHRGVIQAVRFSQPDTLVAGDMTGEVRVWRLPPRSQMSVNHVGAVFDLDFLDNDTLMSGGQDGATRISDLDSRQSMTLAREDEYVVRVKRLNETLALSASRAGTLRIWNRDGSLRAVLPGLTGNVRDFDGSPDGKLIAAGGADRKVLLWQVANATAVGQPRLVGTHDDVIMATRFLDDSTLLTAAMDGNIRIWDLQSGSGETVAETGPIIAVAQAKKSFAFGSNDGRVLWLNIEKTADGKTRYASRHLQSHQSRVYGVALREDENEAASVGRDGVILIHSLSGPGVRRWRLPRLWASAVTYINAGKLLIGSADGTLRILDTANHALSSVTAHSAGINRITVAPDGTRFATGSQDGTIHIWRLADVERSPLPFDDDTFNDWIEKQSTTSVGEGGDIVTPLDTRGERPYGNKKATRQ
jgi:WD40 repeat protein